MRCCRVERRLTTTLARQMPTRRSSAGWGRGDFPELLARETATARWKRSRPEAWWFSWRRRPAIRVLAANGADPDAGLAIARAASQGQREHRGSPILMESLGRDQNGPRFCAVVAGKRRGDGDLRRFRMFSAVARQGFERCGARERPTQVAEQSGERSLEPLLPGFVCASAAMNRLADQIQRMQGHNLTVLITAKRHRQGSGLRAQFTRVGARTAMFLLPTTAPRRRASLRTAAIRAPARSFTGAVADQQGLIHSFRPGATVFLDEIGDLPLDIQPKLLRSSSRARIMPVVAKPFRLRLTCVCWRRPMPISSSASAKGIPRGPFYRLSRHPPLCAAAASVGAGGPHLSTFFLRTPVSGWQTDVHLSSATLDLFSRYWWPAMSRQFATRSSEQWR